MNEIMAPLKESYLSTCDPIHALEKEKNYIYTEI